MPTDSDPIREAIIASNALETEPDWSPDQGLSGVKVIALLSNLAKCCLDDPSKCYVEVGVYRGLTLGAVARSVPDKVVIGIDNFSQFDQDGENKRYVLHHLADLGAANARLVNDDYEHALANFQEHLGNNAIGLYFIDGPHDYRSQLMSLLLARKWLAKDALIVIDDCNYEHVRLATSDFLAVDDSFSLIMQAYSGRHPEAGSREDLERARRGWWNGINVLARHDPDATSLSLSVPVGNARARCEEDHYLHSSRFFGEFGKLTQLADAALSSSSLRFLKRAIYFRHQVLRKAALKSLDRGPNTYSEDLPDFEIIKKE
ncbi:MAG TPA: class I SAM-dependent methyltransferase [Terriglobia bacterium]|nr:class I SAM-dependent methyltransferase [Terriglobia bacterium]